MDKWEQIRKTIYTEKENFKQAYKCINKNIYIKPETVRKHLVTLTGSLEIIREITYKNREKFTEEHKNEVLEVYWNLRDLLVRILDKYNINQKVPHSIEQQLKIDTNVIFDSSNSEKFDTIAEVETDFESEDFSNNFKMTQTVVEFLNTASKLICDFDGKPENLRTFLDSLQLIDSLKGTHEQAAVSLIKTRLKGTARNLISNESSISEIISKLNSSVKGESVEVLTAKIMNIKQNNKSANAYCGEIESLVRSLENAYISDGLNGDLANKYSTQVAVKALTKNCNIDKVKLIMEAGQFNNMNDAISKFVNCCTEATGQQNAILYYGQRPNQHNYRRGRGKFRGRGNFSRNNNNNHNNNNNNNNYSNNNYRNRRGRGNYNGNRNHTRAITTNEDSSENSNAPLRSSQ